MTRCCCSMSRPKQRRRVKRNIDMDWKQVAVDALGQGQSVQVRPRGHSMTGQINDGDLVTLAPCRACELVAGDVVLARIEGRRCHHIVLHRIVAAEQDRFLIGSNSRLDGWVEVGAIVGRVAQIVP